MIYEVKFLYCRVERARAIMGIIIYTAFLELILSQGKKTTLRTPFNVVS